MSKADIFLRLQDVDQQSEGAHAEIARLHAQLADEEDLQRARVRVAELEKRQEAGKRLRQERDAELQAINAKQANSQRELYGGKVQSPKELQRLQEEIASLGRQSARLQDALLEVMVDLEDAGESLKAAQMSMEQMEVAWRQSQQAGRQRLAQLEKRVARLVEAREDVLLRLTPTDVQLYDDLRQRKGAGAVAKLRGNACQACGVNLPTAVARQVRNADDLIFCPSCGRLLCSE